MFADAYNGPGDCREVGMKSVILKDISANILSIDSQGKYASLIGCDSINLYDLSSNQTFDKFKFSSKYKPIDAKWCRTNSNELAVTRLNYLDVYKLRSDSSTIQLHKSICLKNSVRPIKKIEWSPLDPNILSLITYDSFNALIIWDLRQSTKPSLTVDSISSIRDLAWNNFFEYQISTIQENNLVIRDIRNLKSVISVNLENSQEDKYQTICSSYLDPYSILLSTISEKDLTNITSSINQGQNVSQDLIIIDFDESTENSSQTLSKHFDEPFQWVSIIPYTDKVIAYPLTKDSSLIPSYQIYPMTNLERISKIDLFQETDFNLPGLPDNFDSHIISQAWKIYPIDEKTCQISLVTWSESCRLGQYPIVQVCLDEVIHSMKKMNDKILSQIKPHFDFRMTNFTDFSINGPYLFSQDDSKKREQFKSRRSLNLDQKQTNSLMGTTTDSQICHEFDQDTNEYSDTVVNNEISVIKTKFPNVRVENFNEQLHILTLKVFFADLVPKHMGSQRKSVEEDRNLMKKSTFHSDSGLKEPDGQSKALRNNDNWIRFDIRFPSGYPADDAIPKFHIIDMNYIVTNDHIFKQNILKTIHRKAQESCRKGLSCLENCINELLSFLERHQHQGNEREVKINPSVSRRNLTRKIYDRNFPIMRYSGVHFTRTGNLIVFDIDSSSLKMVTKSESSTGSDLKIAKEDKDQKIKLRKTSQLMLKYLCSSDLCTDIRSKNLFQSPIQSKDNFSQINSQLIAVYNFSHLIHLQEFLGRNYDLNIENLESMCHNNLNLVISYTTRIDLCQFWQYCYNLARNSSFTNVSSPRQLPPLATLPFGKEFLDIWRSHFAKIHDLQSLAMFSLVVLSLDRIQMPKIAILDRKLFDQSAKGNSKASLSRFYSFQQDNFSGSKRKSQRKTSTKKDIMNISADLNPRKVFKEEISDFMSRSVSCSDTNRDHSTEKNQSSLDMDNPEISKNRQPKNKQDKSFKNETKIWSVPAGTYADHCRFARSNEIEQLELYISYYSEVLQAWAMLSKRTQLLKHWHTLRNEYFEKAEGILRKLETPQKISNDVIYISPKIWTNSPKASTNLQSYTKDILESNSSSQDEPITMNTTAASAGIKGHFSRNKLSNLKKPKSRNRDNGSKKNIYQNALISLSLTTSQCVSIFNLINISSFDWKCSDTFPKISLQSNIHDCTCKHSLREDENICSTCNNEEASRNIRTNTTNCSICRVKCKGLITMCQKCNHGGHLEHILNWFKERSHCPSINCDCHCIDFFSDNLFAK